MVILLAAHKPPSLPKTKCFDAICNALDYYCKKYQNFLVMGDLNTLESEDVLQDFLEERDLKNLVKFLTCFKSTTNPSAIYPNITSKSQSFQKTINVSTGLSDFHDMVLISMKSTIQNAPPKVILYKDMKKFDKVAFKAKLKEELDRIKPNKLYFTELLHKHAPKKKKTLRANNKPYVSICMRKPL